VGLPLGSVYIRKVAFTDREMVDNITDKVVKRLVQVTSAMKQDGENRVGLIKSQTAFKVSEQMAEAAATRPAVVGDTLNQIAASDPEVLDALMQVMEAEKLIESGAGVDVLAARGPGVGHERRMRYRLSALQCSPCFGRIPDGAGKAPSPTAREHRHGFFAGRYTAALATTHPGTHPCLNRTTWPGAASPYSRP
jgi:hypothetical protein